MLGNLEGRIPEGACLVMRSDQGWHYRIPACITALKRLGARQSMSRKGDCLDDAKAENFFSMTKTELYYDRSGDSIESFEPALEGCIRWCNCKRVELRLSGRSPVEFELSQAA